MKKYLIAIIPLLFAGCGKKDGTQRPAPEVKWVHPEVREIVVWDEYTGRMEAVESVEVRSRVGGMLEKIHFEAGETVEVGKLLFSIDPKPFEASLAAAQASLTQAEASRDLAKSNFERGQQLLERNAIAKEDVDIRSGDFAVATALVKAAGARVQIAELDLSYTQVTAPIKGRISDRIVSQGNLISGGSARSTLLTTIVSIDPIYARLEADEASVLKYMRLDQAGKRTSARNERLPVELSLEGDEGFPRKGYIDFVDNAFDPETATLRARAVFANEDGFLTPGMFGKLRLPGRGKFDATLVPELAIQTQQDFTSLLTVAGDDTIKSVKVTLGSQQGDQRVIESDLPADTRVVVSGILTARPGAKVQPTESAQEIPTEGQ
jgi:RND family efflux transporter MFP subunit